MGRERTGEYVFQLVPRVWVPVTFAIGTRDQELLYFLFSWPYDLKFFVLF